MARICWLSGGMGREELRVTCKLLLMGRSGRIGVEGGVYPTGRQLLKRGREIRVLKVIALKQQRFSGRFRKSVGKAVSEV